MTEIPQIQSKENGDRIIDELKSLLKLSAPLVTFNVLVFSLNLISLMVVGHVGELQLSGAAMASSFTTVTGFSLMMGMAGALETFCGQAYGAGQHHMLGIFMQRAMLIFLIVSLLISSIWANTTNILILLKQDREISIQAGKYARLMIPSIFAFALLQCEVRFLQAQKKVLPLMLASGFTTFLHVLICWLLVFKSSMGFLGAALSIVISYWTNFLLLAAYINFSPSCAKSWTGFSKEAFHKIWEFLKLSIPSAIMFCLEMWAFETMVLVAGRLPNPMLETSVLSISLNICGILFMIPTGVSGATSIRVANELGASRPNRARRVSVVAVAVVLTEGVLLSSSLILGRKFWAHLYSSSTQVVKYVTKMLIIVGASHIVEGLQCTLSGIARGCGWQKMGAIINFGAYYLLGIPMGIVLAFVVHIGGKGLWLGVMTATFIQGLVLSIVVFRTDWDKEAKKAAGRIFGKTIPSLES